MKIIKNLFIFLLFICSFLIGSNVFAVELVTKNAGVFYTYDISDGHKYSEKASYFSIDGIPAYCIEKGVAPGTNQYKLGSESSLSYSKDVIKKIEKVAFYGYGYKGHDDIKYYYASQALIWKYTKGIDVRYSTELFDKGTIIDITNEKNEIQDLVNYDDILPDFDSLDGMIGVERTYTDSNNVLDRFDINYNEDEAEVRRDGNLVMIKPKKKGSVKITYKKNFKYDTKYKIYVSDEYQDMLVRGNIDSRYLTQILSIKGGTININKVDKLTLKPLKGVEYGLYDATTSDLILSSKTNSKGSISFKNLDIGSYYIKEIKTLDGYKLDDSKIDSSISYERPIVDLNLSNELISGSVKIIKEDEDKNRISSVEIGIYDNKDKLIDNYLTDENGEINISDLSYGKYYAKEIKTKDGYELNDKKYEFEIKNMDDVIELHIENKKIEEPVVPEDDNKEVITITNVPSTGVNFNYLYIILISLFSFIYAYKKS